VKITIVVGSHSELDGPIILQVLTVSWASPRVKS